MTIIASVDIAKLFAIGRCNRGGPVDWGVTRIVAPSVDSGAKYAFAIGGGARARMACALQ